MLFGLAKNAEPKNQPDETDCARGDERPLPAPAQINPRHGERRDDRADIRSGVEDASRQRALLFWKPFGNDFDARGKIARLAEAEQKARDAEPDDAAHRGMEHRGATPKKHRQRKARKRADEV